jgi:uncharacterized protein YbbK (DUF523 family)
MRVKLLADYAISACLCGIKCRYDGKVKTDKRCLKLYESGNAILICPEVQGGLNTPRLPCEKREKQIYNINGDDLTFAYIKGAEDVLRKCKKAGVKTAILKERSPSCGSSQIYDGSFSGKLIKGEGICAEMLRKNSIEVYSEENFEFCF